MTHDISNTHFRNLVIDTDNTVEITLDASMALYYHNVYYGKVDSSNHDEVEQPQVKQPQVKQPDTHSEIQKRSIYAINENDTYQNANQHLKDIKYNRNHKDTHHHDERILSSGKIMLEGIRPIVKDTLSQLKQQLNEKDISVSSTTIVPITRIAMQIVERTALKNLQKRELVNELLLRLVQYSSNLSNSQRRMCRSIIESGLINEVIEFVIDATKGKVDINQVHDVAESTVNCCFAFWGNKKSKK